MINIKKPPVKTAAFSSGKTVLETPPFAEGYKAYTKGIAYDDNPYVDNPFIVFRRQWFKGWIAAETEENWFKGIE